MSRGAQLFLWVRPGKGRGFEGLREAITARLDQLTIASRPFAAQSRNQHRRAHRPAVGEVNDVLVR